MSRSWPCLPLADCVDADRSQDSPLTRKSYGSPPTNHIATGPIVHRPQVIRSGTEQEIVRKIDGTFQAERNRHVYVLMSTVEKFEVDLPVKTAPDHSAKAWNRFHAHVTYTLRSRTI